MQGERGYSQSRTTNSRVFRHTALRCCSQESTAAEDLQSEIEQALPLLRAAEWARIVNFSAQSTQRQSARLSAYTAAKAMVTSVSKNLSLFLAPDEILVNVVSPGSIASEALTGWAESVGVDGADPYALMAAID